MLVGAIWTAIGFVYLLWRTRLFRAAPPALTGPAEIEQEERARV